MASGTIKTVASAKDDMGLGDLSVSVTVITKSTSKSITVEQSEAGLLVMTGCIGALNGLYAYQGISSGIGYKAISAATGVTITTSGRTFTIANNDNGNTLRVTKVIVSM